MKVELFSWRFFLLVCSDRLDCFHAIGCVASFLQLWLTWHDLERSIALDDVEACFHYQWDKITLYKVRILKKKHWNKINIKKEIWRKSPNFYIIVVVVTLMYFLAETFTGRCCWCFLTELFQWTPIVVVNISKVHLESPWEDLVLNDWRI